MEKINWGYTIYFLDQAIELGTYASATAKWIVDCLVHYCFDLLTVESSMESWCWLLVSSTLCFVVVWNRLWAFESICGSRFISICYTWRHVMILHPSKTTMERHDLCHIFFFLLKWINVSLYQPAPVSHCSQRVCLKWHQCTYLEQIFAPLFLWVQTKSVQILHSLIAIKPFKMEKPLLMVPILPELHKFWHIWSIKPEVFPKSSNSLGPRCSGWSFPTTSSIQNMICTSFQTTLSIIW